MPVLDWIRTDLDWPLPNGAQALRFDQARFAAFDLFILARPGAEHGYSQEIRRRSQSVYETLSTAERDQLTHHIAAGLPGATTDSLSLESFRDRLAQYHAIDATRLRQHLIEFLAIVAPVASKLGVRLTLHPDDPPRPLFGLPRIASNAADYQALFDAIPDPSNGMCLCTGSLGVAPQNHLPQMVKQFGPRIYFAHLRNTLREADGSFYEADHLGGDCDMIAVVAALLDEERRRGAGDAIAFRPDHGHKMLDDLTKPTNPGYSAIGRLKGLAELRGAIKALAAMAAN
jgi:mannonate dehydratase